MAIHYFKQTSQLATSVDDVFAWHEQPEAFQQLTPPWVTLKSVKTTGVVPQDGSIAVLTLQPFWPLCLSWVAVHESFKRSELFVDVQQSGPFAAWRHEHRFTALTDSTCEMTDCIWYSLHGAPYIDWAYSWFIAADIKRLFAYRHQVLAQHFGTL